MPQKTPAQMVIDRVFTEYAAEGFPNESIDDVWEIYVSDLLLREKSIDYEELRSGIVDGRQDGGIDAFYTFLNGTLVMEDHPALESDGDAARLGGDGPTVEVLLVQAKNKSSWEEIALDKLHTSLPALLDPSKSQTDLMSRFRDSLVRQVLIYRVLSQNLAVKFPKFSFRIVYATRAPETNISETLLEKAEQVRDVVAALLTPGATVTCNLIGADKIYELAGTTHSSPAELRFRNSMIREDGSYLGIANLTDYLTFVRDDNGELRSEMFESNVRDYEGVNQVNNSIQATLAKQSDAEFWWQNNGVTVLGRRVNGPYQTLTIEQPLIVNGLQTTHVLHQAERDGNLHESRASEGIVVRVIESDDDNVRDQVIAGTNRQTRVDGSSLYATDGLQIDIERFFLANDWYYERRKNRYKNLKKPTARRVSISLLGQAVITLGLGEPDAARARPTTVLGRRYDAVFNSTFGSPAYLRAARLLQEASSFLRTDRAKQIVNDYSNIRFYFLIGIAMRHLRVRSFTDLKFSQNHHRLPENFTEIELLNILSRVAQLFEDYASDRPDHTRDAVAKSSDFRRWFLSELNADLSQTDSSDLRV